MDTSFDKEGILNAFNALGRRAHEDGKTIEISVYGGSALTLTYDWRVSTKDVDAVFEANKVFVRQQVAEIADEMGWDSDWLNDGVKRFVSEADSMLSSKRLLGTFPSEDEPGLRVMVASPEYIFAMKCRAMRMDNEYQNSDVSDIRRLAIELGITTLDEAVSVISAFYPMKFLEPKTRHYVAVAIKTYLTRCYAYFLSGCLFDGGHSNTLLVEQSNDIDAAGRMGICLTLAPTTGAPPVLMACIRAIPV